ncbi:MAG: O-antigen ligase family protein [Phycisphaerae bacterium]
MLAGATLLLTQSKGAVAACGAGLAMVFAAEAAHGRIAARARQTWRGFWIGLALAVLVVVVVGAIRGGLPTRSLLFRWQYWRGAAETFLRAPFTGVGSDNFGRYFTRDKPVECPEDVQDPHSWLVRLAVEWGPLGLAGFVALLVGLSRQLLAPRDLPATSGRPHSAIVCLALVWLLSMTAVVAVFGTSDAAYLVLTFGVAAAVWPVAAFGVCASRSATADAPVDGGLVPSAPLAGAAFAFLLHTVTDTALFAPGAATLFFALLAGLVSPHVRRGGQSSESRPTAAMASLLIGAGAIAVFAALLVVPTAQTAERLDRARKSAGPAEFDAYVAAPVHASYAAAIESDPLDATAAIELAGELAHRCRTAPQADQVLSLLDLAQRRDPDHIGIDGLRAGVLAIRFDATHDPADLAGAVEAAGRAVAADATRPQPRLALAALLERLDAVAPDAANRERAVAELRVALRLDAERVYVSPLHRLSAARREEIARQIETLLRPATRPSGAGTPQSQPSSAAIRSS